MENNVINENEQATALVITPENLLNHWQGHRKLTRRVIEAFPEDKLFNYSVGGMRTFAELALEMINMAGPGVRGVATGTWKEFEADSPKPKTKEELLKAWDNTTAEIDSYWPQIPAGRFQEMDVAFGQYEGPVYWTLFYFIDNEIHHRGQGYVYLRSLGIAPPPFWERQ
ncbi:MAG TPA: DinB family protein [Cytophagales bacterium]|nr:DinB family protein [Cytophagales bacterium]